VSPAYGQFGIIRLKTVPELHEAIAAYDENRPEAFAPMREVRESYTPIFSTLVDSLRNDSYGWMA
jgi:predicted S18 family serine protease